MLYAVPTGIFPQRLLKLVKKVCFPFCVSECFKIKINTNKIKEEGAEEQGGFTGKKVLVTCAYIYIYIYIYEVLVPQAFTKVLGFESD